MRVVRRIERGLTPSPGRNSAGITYPAESSLPRPTHALPASGISLPAGSFVPCVRASGALLVTRPNGEGWPVLFTDALDDWIRDAVDCGIHTMQKFAVKLRYDINAVRNAICKPWSNGRTEGRKCSNAQCMGEPVSHCSDLGCAPSVRSRITKREPEPNNGQRDSGLLHGSNA
jgi:Transposase